MDTDKQRAARALCSKAGLNPPEVAGWVYRRYSGGELGPDWQAFEVETLGLPEERFAFGLAGWRGGPAEIEAPLQPEWSGVVLLRFRLVRHRTTRVELGMWWHPDRDPPDLTQRWGAKQHTVQGEEQLRRAYALLTHPTWKQLQRPARISFKPQRVGRWRLEDLPPEADSWRDTADKAIARQKAGGGSVYRVAGWLGMRGRESLLKKYIDRRKKELAAQSP